MTSASDNFLCDLIIVHYRAIHPVCIAASGVFPDLCTGGNIAGTTAGGTIPFKFILNLSLQKQNTQNN